MKSKNIISLISVAIFFLLNLPANSTEYISAYTDINLDECLLLGADDFRAEWACPGYRGFPLYIAESDLRFYVSYGFGAPNEKSANQTLPVFNYINDVIEWRLMQTNGNFIPFATILRWFPDIYDENGIAKKGNILVVTKLEQNNTCHIAYIDAKIIPNANELAREIADNKAENFNCEIDEIYRIDEK